MRAGSGAVEATNFMSVWEDHEWHISVKGTSKTRVRIVAGKATPGTEYAQRTRSGVGYEGAVHEVHIRVRRSLLYVVTRPVRNSGCSAFRPLIQFAAHLLPPSSPRRLQVPHIVPSCCEAQCPN